MIDATKKLFRWGPLDAAVLPLGYTIEASFDKMYDLFGVCWPESLIIFDHDKAIWILESDSVSDASNLFTDKIIIPDEENKKFYDLWETKILNLQEIQTKITEEKIANSNDQELNEFFAVWSKIYLDFWAVGMAAELINYSLEARLKDSLKSKFPDVRDMNEAFALLSTPSKTSFYKEEEMDLMKIVLVGTNEKNVKLQKHQHKYFWIYNNYLEAKELNINFFKDQIKHTSAKDAIKFLEEFEGYEEKVERQKQDLINKINLSMEEKKTVELLNKSIIFQDQRKKYNLMAAHYLEKFLNTISDRKRIPNRDLKWLLPNEIEKITQGEDQRQLIEQRKHLTVISRSLENNKVEVREAASRKDHLFNNAAFEKSTNLQGTVASTSNNRYFRGTARLILSPKDGDKLQPGEILVTTMTTPDYVIFMKRAGAIITDVGGVTCHAAVVSREFGIPCIVGTENATKIVQDGDILELHNLRGTVKITPS